MVLEQAKLCSYFTIHKTWLQQEGNCCCFLTHLALANMYIAMPCTVVPFYTHILERIYYLISRSY